MALRTRDELAPFFATAAAEAKAAWEAAVRIADEAGSNVAPNSPAEPYLPLADFLEDGGDPRHLLVKAHWSGRPMPEGCSSDDYLNEIHVVALPDGSNLRFDAYRGGVVTHWDGFQKWAGMTDRLDAPLPFSAVLTSAEAAELAEGLPEGETTVVPPEGPAGATVSHESLAAFVRRLYRRPGLLADLRQMHAEGKL